MKRLLLSLVMVMSTTAANADELTWAKLASRPDLWPGQCVMKADIQFEGGVGVKKGETVKTLRFSNEDVQASSLDDKTTFAAYPEEINCLEVAAKDYAALTPKQKDLSYASLVGRKDLWPSEITLNQGFKLDTGRVEAGEKMRVVNVQGQGLTVLCERLKTNFQVVPQATDIMAQARRLVEDPDAAPRFAVMEQKAQEVKTAAAKKKAEEPILSELEGHMVNSQTGKPDPLDKAVLPKYIVFFRGSSTCPITRQFLPKVVSFYKQMKPQHPEFEMVFMMTEDFPDHAKFARMMGFDWRAVSYEDENTTTMPISSGLISGKLPQMMVFDRQGHVLANGTQDSAPAALNKLASLLNTK